MRDCTPPPSHFGLSAVTVGSPSREACPRINRAVLWLNAARCIVYLCLCVYTCGGLDKSLPVFLHILRPVYLHPLLAGLLYFPSFQYLFLHLCTPHLVSRALALSPGLLVAIWSFPAATMKRLPFRIQIKQKAAPATGRGAARYLLPPCRLLAPLHMCVAHAAIHIHTAIHAHSLTYSTLGQACRP